MSELNTWSTTAASNNATPPNGFPEGMAPSTVNDAAREVMAAVARYRSDTDGVNTSSGTNTIALTASRTMTAYAQGDLYTFKAGGTNTGATTLNISSLGAKDVQLNGAALVGGEIVSGLMYTVVYDGTQFQLMNVSGVRVISVTDNTNAALRVTQTGTANALEVEDATNPDSSPFIVDATGNVVKGYTAAVPTVGITSAAYTPGIQGHFSGSIRGDFGLYTWSTNTVFANTLNFSRSNNATIGTYTAVTSGTDLGDILWCGADGDSTGSQFAPAARISGRCTGTVADGSVPGSLWFATTATGGTNPAVRVSINEQGFVGIGDSFITQQKLLDIAGNNTGLTNDSPVTTLRFTDTDGTTAANQPIGKIEFYNSDAGNAAVGAYILASAVGTSGGGTLRFAAAADAGAAAEIARIASTGLTVTANTAGLGYGTGSGGAVTQATSRTTGVTLDKTNGAITLVSAAGSATWQSFTVTNSTVAATDVVVLSQRSGTDLYMLEVTAVAAGSFRISFATTGGTTTEQPVFNFAVIKAVTA